MGGDFKHSVRREAGHITITGDGITLEADTLQCCHCGCHWQVVRGSGKLRGFCTKCNQVTCGAPGCGACVPWEKQLDIMEGEANPTAVTVGASRGASSLWFPFQKSIEP